MRGRAGRRPRRLFGRADGDGYKLALELIPSWALEGKMAERAHGLGSRIMI